MCGISGVMLLAEGRSRETVVTIAEAMANSMVHRGPDSAGTWQNERGDVAFGHRRLAIVDLTPAGHQPMTSADRRWTITYNGELYNTGDLRSRLESPPGGWRGHSDTQVLIEAIAAWGVHRTVERADGMFAFGAFDHARNELWLARDRFGEKPLYYRSTSDAFTFSSELRGIIAASTSRPEFDRASLVELLERGFIGAPHTIFESVFKLEPGSVARVTAGGRVTVERYFDPSEVALRGSDGGRSDADAIAEFEALLGDVVASRMVSDVPLGAFLSSGVDSTMVVAKMQQASSHTVRTFTIGFETEALNEAPAARTIAETLGTEHHEWVVTGADALAIVPDLGRLYDEPFADSSQIPTTLVSRFARQEVTVALSGDGGDELFGGYERYQLFERASRLRRLPRPVSVPAARALSLVSEDQLDRLGSGRAARLLPQPLRNRTGKRLHTAAAMLSARDDLELYDLLMRPHRQGPALVPGTRRRDRPHAAALNELRPVEIGMAIDTTDYLPNDILTKVDRASMSTSLETRAPMLDQRLHEFAWSLRPDQRVRDGRGKWLVREAVRAHVPNIAGLPKRGFGVPLASWLRGPLRSWASDLLAPTSLDSSGLLDGALVREIWRRHLEGDQDRSVDLWPVLMLESWRKTL